jgi:hypothetical protein
VINHKQVSCCIEPIGPPTTYVNSNVIKYIRPKLFYPHEFQINGEISILQIKLCNNLTYLFTMSLLYTTFSKCVANIGIYRLRDLQELGGASS